MGQKTVRPSAWVPFYPVSMLDFSLSLPVTRSSWNKSTYFSLASLKQKICAPASPTQAIYWM